MKWTKRISIAVVLSALTVTVGVAPAVAAPLQDYGATYSCRYRTIEGSSPAMGDPLSFSRAWSFSQGLLGALDAQ